MERHQLSIERLQMIDQEETVQDRYRPYFRMCAAFLLKLESLRRTIEDHSFENLHSGREEEMESGAVCRYSGGKL